MIYKYISRVIITILLYTVSFLPVSFSQGLYTHTSRATGEILTANIYNADHINHITNQTPQMTDDYSANNTQMQATTDPYPGGVESLPTSLAGELERIRYVIKQLSGKAQWYIDPDTTAGIINYRSGLNCKQASATTITVQGGVIEVDGTTIIKTTNTTLTLTTATDWVDDTSDQAVSAYRYIYINNAGQIEMDATAPDASDTSDNTTGLLRYQNTGTDTSWRRVIGSFLTNATGAGELDSRNVWTFNEIVGLGGGYIRLHDSKATTTEGGTFTSGAWQLRTVTEDMDTGNNCSVATNVITLEAGTYDCFIQCPANEVQAHQARLRNTSDGVNLLLGHSAYSYGAGFGQASSIIQGRFTINSQKTLEIQHRCQTTMGTSGFGKANSFGENEIYTTAEFWKVYP